MSQATHKVKNWEIFYGSQFKQDLNPKQALLDMKYHVELKVVK